MHPDLKPSSPVVLGYASKLRSGIPLRSTLTVPADTFQPLPILCLSQQVLRHRWKKGILKKPKGRAGFSKRADAPAVLGQNNTTSTLPRRRKRCGEHGASPELTKAGGCWPGWTRGRRQSRETNRPCGLRGTGRASRSPGNPEAVAAWAYRHVPWGEGQVPQGLQDLALSAEKEDGSVNGHFGHGPLQDAVPGARRQQGQLIRHKGCCKRSDVRRQGLDFLNDFLQSLALLTGKNDFNTHIHQRRLLRDNQRFALTSVTHCDAKGSTRHHG